jgi:hypothetical protein
MLIEEDMRTHECNFSDIPIKDGRELFLDHTTDLGLDKNNDHVSLAWGLDGVLYRLVECKHNPPHSTKRKFTDDTCRPPDKLPVYWGGSVCRPMTKQEEP